MSPSIQKKLPTPDLQSNLCIPTTLGTGKVVVVQRWSLLRGLIAKKIFKMRAWYGKRTFTVEQWFSTISSLRHTNFENKFGGTPKCKKETNMLKI
jgi:hypothetical protein